MAEGAGRAKVSVDEAVVVADLALEDKEEEDDDDDDVKLTANGTPMAGELTRTRFDRRFSAKYAGGKSPVDCK